MLKYTICFIRYGDDVLMLNRRFAPNLGLWNGLGGKIEAGETPRQCIVREMHEETGLTLPPDAFQYKGIVTWGDGGMYAFVADLPTDKLTGLWLPDVTDEGILAFLPVEWVCNPNNWGVVDNIPWFLGPMLTATTLANYACGYREGRLYNVAREFLPPEFQNV